MTKDNKQIASYVFSALGFAAGIGGIFYASKKGYGGWGKFGMFILFGSPFGITSTALAMSSKKSDNVIGYPEPQGDLMAQAVYDCADGVTFKEWGNADLASSVCDYHGGIVSASVEYV